MSAAIASASPPSRQAVLPRAAGRQTAWPRVARVLWWIAVIGFVAPRLYSASPLWLDETLSVNIAALPIPALLEALRHDGSPPLYYLVLQGWMTVFGSSDLAVRALSSVCSVASLPAAWVAARMLGGRRAAAAAVLVLAASPFAVRYATEARMYAFVMLLTLCWLIAATAAWRRASAARLAVVAILTGALELSHYWTLFLLLTAGVLLVALGLARRRARRRALGMILALAAGSIAFLPWLPSFLFQAAHTGTPWSGSSGWSDLVAVIQSWGGSGPLALFWGFGLLVAAVLWSIGLIALGIVGARSSAGRWVLAWGWGALACGLVVSHLQGAGFVPRYSSPMIAVLAVAAGLGLARLRTPWRAVTSAVLVVLSAVILIFSPLLGLRTQAAAIADVLIAKVQAGDVVVYCPDQVGPAVSRLLPAGVDQIVYPTGGSPQLVDWVDYAARNAAASPAAFAADLSSTTSGSVWLVRADGYLTYGDQCAGLDDALTALRGGRTVELPPASGVDGSFVISYAAIS